ncbi:hypothetical protein IHO40_02975 [Wolbachia endosymbiont of Mansonella ozzardi]|uniref:hypothetical protein n=1 Tax=Wolbachia endosymbiont of Mansonella ozzardi TaxID=137464 RepID=UPI001CE10A16|nr:hypothetical protein [Wolbachia endosymbiont of Mansonella ozzardi]MCA4775067.1 hypothetical protein [Wolbachia endosymbiont of Mansonella ozzardi]
MPTGNSTETVSLIQTSSNLNVSNNLSDSNPTLNVQSVPKSTLNKDENKYVVLDDEKAWNKFFALQNDPSTNTTNKRKPEPYVHKDNDGAYKYTTRGKNKYKGKDIRGKVAECIKQEISENAKNNTVKFIRLKEAKFASMNENGIVEPSVRVMLGDNSKEINMVDILSGDMCKKCHVRAITLMLPTDNQSEKRGIRCRIDNDGKRIYEVANGSYQMALKWYVEGKECKVKILISDDGSIKLVEGNDVTKEQLLAHREVKVGRQYEAKFLYEALASQLQQKSSESIKVWQQPSTGVTDVDIPQQHQTPAIQAK